MGVLGTLFTGVFAATGGAKKTTASVPPINAASKDEENFIQYAPDTPTPNRSTNCHIHPIIA